MSEVEPRECEPEWLDRLFEQSPRPLALLLGSDHVFKRVNPAYKAAIGGRDVIGLSARDAFPDAEDHDYFELLDQVYATGQPHTAYAVRALLPSGPAGELEERFVNLLYQPIRDAAGHVVGIFTEGIDVTEARRTRRAAREVERRHAFLADLSDALRALAEPEDVMANAAEWLGRHLQTGRCGYGEVDASGAFFAVKRDWTNGATPSLAGRHPLDDFGPKLIKEFRDGQTVRLDDPLADARTEEKAEAYLSMGGMRAGIAVPLLKADRFVAALYIHQTSPRNWSDAEERLVRAVAERTWAAVERARAEAALRDSEAALRFALEAGGFGSWSRDLITGELVTSKVCRESFGRDPAADFTYAQLRDSVHPDDKQRMADVVAHSIATGTDYKIEYRIVMSAGDVRWIDVRGRPAYSADGTPVRIAGFSLDITERKNVEARRDALVVLSDRLRDLDDPADVAFAAAEIIGRTLGVSRAGYGTIDKDAETITIERDWNAPGIKSLAGTLRFRDYGSYIEDLKRGETVVFADAEKDPRTAETAQALKVISAQSVVNMPVTEQGGFVALLYLNHATARDWSADELAFIREVADRTRTTVERRRVEQELRLLAATLERQAVVRTAELVQTQDALRQSQKLEAMGQLTGGVAHDFNNLLTPIIGSLDMLQRRGIGGEREQRMIDGALQSAERAKTLVQRLLAFARRQPLQPTAVDLHDLVTSMRDLVVSTLGPQIKVAFDVPPGLPTAKGDTNQLEMAILNLAVNARDAMPKGGTVTISASKRTARPGHDRDIEPGDYVRLAVTDNGSGMDQATLARAVEPFFSTKGIGKGTGLGLSMVHGLTSQLGGGLVISSEPGVGTTVELWLPLSADAIANNERTHAAASKTPSAGTALLVDDEDLVRATTADMLIDLGYDLIEATSAEKALAVIENGHHVDLLVTDHLMPGMSGADLAREVRERQPDCPVLIISGFAEAEGIAPDLARLTKPFRHAELATMLAFLTARAAARRTDAVAEHGEMPAH